MSSAQFRQREWVDARAIDRVWTRFKSGEAALHTIIWRWLSLEIWARTCLAPKPVKVRAHVSAEPEVPRSVYAQ